MLIGEVSRHLNLPIETLRYYDRIGLVSPTRISGVRRYSDVDIQRLTAVIKMKGLMFSLEEIQTILSVDAQVDVGIAQASLDLAAVRTLLEQLDAKYREVAAMEQNIKDVKNGLAQLVAKVKAVLEEAGQND